MKPAALTFDCAETLVVADWNYAHHAMECLERAGAKPDDAWIGLYLERLQRRWFEYVEVNRSSAEAVEAFWRDFTREFLAAVNQPDELLEPVMAASEAILYGPETAAFPVFEDVRPTLDELQARGYRMAVVSNWDASLERILAARGLDRYFEVVVASMVFGQEKPSPGIFHHAIEQMNLTEGEVLHIGDNPLDDVQGARRAGLQALLIDRASTPAPGRLSDLRQLLDLVA